MYMWQGLGHYPSGRQPADYGFAVHHSEYDAAVTGLQRVVDDRFVSVASALQLGCKQPILRSDVVR